MILPQAQQGKISRRMYFSRMLKTKFIFLVIQGGRGAVAGKIAADFLRVPDTEQSDAQ